MNVVFLVRERERSCNLQNLTYFFILFHFIFFRPLLNNADVNPYRVFVFLRLFLGLLFLFHRFPFWPFWCIGLYIQAGWWTSWIHRLFSQRRKLVQHLLLFNFFLQYLIWASFQYYFELILLISPKPTYFFQSYVLRYCSISLSLGIKALYYLDDDLNSYYIFDIDLELVSLLHTLGVIYVSSNFRVYVLKNHNLLPNFGKKGGAPFLFIFIFISTLTSASIKAVHYQEILKNRIFSIALHNCLVSFITSCTDLFPITN